MFCVCCRFAHKHKLFTFSKRGDQPYSVNGFDNLKKSLEKLRRYKNSDSHLEAEIKFRSLRNSFVKEQISNQAAKVQATRQAGLLKQLQAMHYILKQGIPLRGHTEEEGNLCQSHNFSVIASWIEQGKYMSHEIVNELIMLMGQNVLRRLLSRIKANDPGWYAIVADEATDVACREQFNVSIRYVDSHYMVRKDCIGLISLPDTKASTLHIVLKDMLICCNLPLSLC